MGSKWETCHLQPTCIRATKSENMDACARLQGFKLLKQLITTITFIVWVLWQPALESDLPRSKRHTISAGRKSQMGMFIPNVT